MKRYVVVGLGARSEMFTLELARRVQSNGVKFVGICDSNPGRLAQTQKMLAEKVPDIKAYDAEDFDKMLAELKPDTVVVTTLDRLHHEYICRAMRAGCDAVTEKPMTVDETKCQQIVDTVGETGKSMRVTFNYRYSPPRSQVKELLMEGTIGKVLSVEFKWLLDTSHGADYFRRWHRNKRNSGGLMVHKATHHFDLVNWWIGSAPQTVAAQGGRVFYNNRQAARYGLQDHSNRCHDCPVAKKCNFFFDLEANEKLKSIYMDHEHHDGYIRDRCVFGDDIDIEDTMNVSVHYRSGAYMAYSLNAFSPWEGYSVAFNGTKGRLEHSCCETSYVSGDGSVPGEFQAGGTQILVFPHFKPAYQVPVREGKGGHGGGDALLLEDVFGQKANDPLGRAASHVQGAYSILTGIAANKSMAESRMVHVDELVHGLPEPGYPIPPGEDEQIPYVTKKG